MFLISEYFYHIREMDWVLIQRLKEQFLAFNRLIITLSAGAIILGFTFIEQSDFQNERLLLASWILFAVSVIAGIFFETTFANSEIMRGCLRIDQLEAQQNSEASMQDCLLQSLGGEVDEERRTEIIKGIQVKGTKIRELEEELKEKRHRFWGYFNHYVSLSEKIQKIAFLLAIASFTYLAIITLL